jgi:hypothetical protein
MRKPKIPEVKLPYASTVANFFNDQGPTAGNSFLGRFFGAGAQRQVVINPAGVKPSANPNVGQSAIGSLFNRGGSK